MVEQSKGERKQDGRELPEPARADLPLWGAKRIANAAGVSAQTVRRSWAKDPANPVRRVGGRLFAWRGELINWLRAAS